MKRLRVLFLACVLCIVAVCAWSAASAVSAEPMNAGDYQFMLREDGTGIITRYLGSAGDVEIPSELNGIPVTAIGAYAFAGCVGLTEITLPFNVTTIGERAFYYCIQLENVEFPDSLEVVHPSAFENCTSLTDLPDLSEYAPQ